MAAGFSRLDQDLGWPAGPDGDFVQIDYGWRTAWALVAEYSHPDGAFWIVADDVISHRVHDEGELIPYWYRIKEEGTPRSHAYGIADSAYLTELRQGVSGLIEKPLRHILLTGQNVCLELIVTTLPIVSPTRPESVESIEAWEQIRNARQR